MIADRVSNRQQMYVEGDILRIAEGRNIIIMDATDRPLLDEIRVWVRSDGRVYSVTKVSRKTRALSSLLLNLEKGEYVKHLNGNLCDNRRANLVVQKYRDVIWTREGEVLRVKTKDGREILMDAEDEHMLSVGYIGIRPNGYAWYCPMSSTKMSLLSRLIMKTDVGMCCDHINGNILDNRRANLRPCTNAQNSNNHKKHKNSTNIYKGVFYDPRADSNLRKRYRVQLRVGRKLYFVGRYTTAEEAARAYNAKALELSGPFARLNVLERPGETVSAAEITP